MLIQFAMSATEVQAKSNDAPETWGAGGPQLLEIFPSGLSS